jgi:muconolactone delta-isomerase
MLFMVISTPRPDQPSNVREQQKKWWIWLDELTRAGTVKHTWTKTGRGAVVVFDVQSHEELHKLVNQWSENVPATFEVIPLVAKEHQERIAMAGMDPMKL